MGDERPGSDHVKIEGGEEQDVPESGNKVRIGQADDDARSDFVSEMAQVFHPVKSCREIFAIS